MSDYWCPYCDYEPEDREDKVNHIEDEHLGSPR